MRGITVIHLRISRSTIRAEVKGPASWAAEAAFDTPAELADVIARLAAEAPRNGKHPRGSVVLERPLVQVRTLRDLPPVKPRDLAALVAGQQGRFFRKNGQPLVTDAAWVPGTNGMRMARAAAVEEPWLEAIALGARTAGLVLDAIAPADAGELSLLPAEARAERRRVSARSLRRWAVVTAGLWVALGALHVARLTLGRRHVERELARLAAPAAALLDARRELWDAAGMLGTIDSVAGARSAVASQLARITASLPDSAFVTSLTVDTRGQGVITGLALRAVDVLARLEGRGAVPHPHFDGPVLRETTAGRNWERFTILFGADR